MSRVLDAEERSGLRRLIDRETRRRNLPAVRARIAREHVRMAPVAACRTPGCHGQSKTHAGPYAGLCDECIVARGHHLALA